MTALLAPSQSLWGTFFLVFLSFLKIFSMFILGRERETEHEQGRGRERRSPRIWSRLQAPSCQPKAWHRAWTQEPWDHDLSWSQSATNWATQVPPTYFFISCSILWYCELYASAHQLKVCFFPQTRDFKAIFSSPQPLEPRNGSETLWIATVSAQA